MKELNRFRQFLTEGQINENTVEQTRDIIVQRLQSELGHDEELDAMYQGYIPLVQQADSMADLAMLIDKFGSEVYKVTGDGQWEEYIVKDTPLVDRKTFEIPTNEGEEVNEYMDISKPGNPLYDLNNDSKAMAELDRIADKYGLLALQLWVTSGNYPQDY